MTRNRVRLLALALAAPGLASTALRAEINPYYFGVSETYTRQANLLRLGDGLTANSGYSRSDSWWSTAVAAGVDQSFGRQRAAANLSLRNSRYANNSIFNNQGYSGNASLDWSTAERIAGTLSATANRSLGSFNYYNADLLAVRQRNLESTESLSASVGIGLVTQYSLEFYLNHRQVRNSLQLASVLARDFTQDDAGLTLRWKPSSGATFGLGLHQLQGRYPKYQFNLISGAYFADRFKQPGIDLSVALKPSGASSLEARLGYSRTQYDLNQKRNFSGVTGLLGWAWQPSGKLRINTRLWRDTGQNSYALSLISFASPSEVPSSAEYSQLVNTLKMQADYDIAAKVALNTSLAVTQRNFAQNLAGLSASGKDSSAVLAFGGRWAPLRSVLVGCDLSWEKRTASGTLTTALKDNSVGCFGQFQLQQ